MSRPPGADRTVVEVHADPDGRRAQCRTTTGALSARVLGTDHAGAHVALVANRALLLAGDHVEVELLVGPGAWLTVTEVTGTVAYDAGGLPSSWSVVARVGAGALLTWDAPPFVVATGARVERSTQVDLATGAVAGWHETLVLGRTGEPGGYVRSTTRVQEDGVPLLDDECVLGDPGVDLVTRGAARVLDAATVVGFRPTPPQALTDAHGTTHLELARPGASVRRLARQAHLSTLDDPWRAWQAEARSVHHRRLVR